MGYVIGALFWLFVIIYFIAKDSKKETTKERYGEAVGTLAHKTADSISGFVQSLTESDSDKQRRKAIQIVASRHWSLYNGTHCSDDYRKSLFVVDDELRFALSFLGLSEDRWKIVAKKIHFIGIIREESKELFSNMAIEHMRESRARKLKEWVHEPILSDNIKRLKQALAYFNIEMSDWVKYGDAVVEMYRLSSDRDLQDFGYLPC